MSPDVGFARFQDVRSRRREVAFMTTMACSFSRLSGRERR